MPVGRDNMLCCEGWKCSQTGTECSQCCRNGKWWISENLEMLGKWSNEKVHTCELIMPAYEERMPTRVRNENAHTRWCWSQTHKRNACSMM